MKYILGQSALSKSMVVALAMAAGFAVPVGADTYTANTFLPPNHPQGKVLIDYAEDVREATGGKVDFEVFTGGSLLPPREGLQGLSDGVAQLGYFAGTYTPNELPLTNVLSNLAFNTSDMMVAALAYTEVNLTNELLQKEWADNNIVFVSGHSTDSYLMICRGQADNLAFFEGKKIRTPGGLWSRFAESVGAIPVNVPASEMYTGLERGLLDCVNNEVVALKDRSLWDVTDSVNLAPLGTYFVGAAIAFNSPFWNGLDAETRSILLDESASALTRMEAGAFAGNVAARGEAEVEGITFHEPNEEIMNAIEAFRAADLAELLAGGRYDVADPKPVVDAYLEAAQRWTELLEGVDYADEVALAEIVRKEILSKIDVEAYGMR
ncbi:C4-dicarboxylate TRAP transporter substrate-binding protein [Roseovarius aestuarii]|nr:C4-dicarboxylate TRAP transporter substrate-binding protein [Roseovarius aestuarii]